MVSWYLIERACFSLISALSRITDDALRFVLAFDGRGHGRSSSKAAFMP